MYVGLSPLLFWPFVMVCMRVYFFVFDPVRQLEALALFFVFVSLSRFDKRIFIFVPMRLVKVGFFGFVLFYEFERGLLLLVLSDMAV